jgi:hypothetical protein
VKNDTPDLLLPDNVVRMPRQLSEEELIRLQDMDDAGEFDEATERKLRRLEKKKSKHEEKPEDPNLNFDF